MYILLMDDDTVQEIVPDEDPVFPGIPIEERYAPDFVARLIRVPGGTQVEQGWSYDRTEQTFSPPPEPDPTLDLDDTLTAEEGYTTADMMRALLGQ